MAPMNDDRARQLLYGNLETLVLAALEREPMHGYGLRRDLAERSGDTIQVSFGRLYPLLHGLEKRHLITSRLVRVGAARAQRVYALTPQGRQELAVLRATWTRFCGAMNALLN